MLENIISSQTKGNVPISRFGFNGKITRVKGERGLKTHYIAPNSVLLIADELSPIIWLVQTDTAGYRLTRSYDLRSLKEGAKT